MPIPLPNLDDRTYAELTAEAQALIPHLYPAWTNHNPSDPGIMVIELFAWLTEMLLFEVNQVPAANIDKFLALLNGPIPTWTRPAEMSLDEAIRQILAFGRNEQALPTWIAPEKHWVRPDTMTQDEAVGQTLRELRERYRAVTPADYEMLVLHAWPHDEKARELGAAGQIQRAHCVPQRNLAASTPDARRAPAPAHVSLVIVPVSNENYPQPSAALCQTIQAFFAPRRLLTTRQHVVGPSYVPVTITASLALRADAPPPQALADARAALLAFCHPLTGGTEGQGWPFGGALYRSEIYAVLEQVALINYIEEVQLATSTGADRLLKDGAQVIGIALDDHELVQLAAINLVAYDVYGYRYA